MEESYRGPGRGWVLGASSSTPNSTRLSVTGFAFMPGFDYYVTGEQGSWAVFVRVPSDDPHGGTRDPSVAVADEHGPYFEITVGIPGG